MISGTIPVFILLGIFLLFSSSDPGYTKKTSGGRRIFDKDEYLEQNSIPERSAFIMKYDYEGDSFAEDFYIWAEEDALRLVLTYKSWMGMNLKYEGYTNTVRVDIPRSCIKQFRRIGEVYTDVSGGGSDRARGRRAAIFGDETDEIIASRQEIKTTRVDERQTILTVEDDGVVKNIFFESEDYEKFLIMIPEKEESYIRNFG